MISARHYNGINEASAERGEMKFTIFSNEAASLFQAIKHYHFKFHSLLPVSFLFSLLTHACFHSFHLVKFKRREVLEKEGNSAYKTGN